MNHSVQNEAIHARRWKILAVLNLSLVIVVAGNSSLNVALPTLVRDLDATNAQLQWIVDAYALVFAGLLLTMGALGDRLGRKGLLQSGLAVFAAGALLATMGTEPWHLIATRALMGVGAAMIMPATLSILTNVFPAGERGKAIAIWAGFAGAGVAIGPLVSGFLLEHFWYGSVFFVNVPMLLAAFVAGAVLVPTSRDPEQGSLDLGGTVLSVAGLGVLLFAIIQGPDRGWTDPTIVAAFAFAVVTLGAFVEWERRAPNPMLPMRFFSDRGFSAGAAAIGVTYFVLFGLFFVATQYLQFVLQYSPLEAGAASLPVAAALLVAAPRSAILAARFGRERVVSTGIALVGVGMVGMLLLTPQSTYWNLILPMVLIGVGMGLAIAPATDSIMEAMPLRRAGVGSAVNDTAREVGGSLGVAVLGSFLSAGFRDSLEPQLQAVPPPVAETARESVGGALAVARELPASAGDALALAARGAFDDGMGVAMAVGAVVAAASAVAVLRWLRRSPDVEIELEPAQVKEPDPEPSLATAHAATTR